MHPAISAVVQNFEKALQHLAQEFASLQIGRASPGMVESIEVEIYGSKQPIRNIAQIAITDPRSLAITPWDKTAMEPIAKAIRDANIGLNPVNDGVCVRINIPALTEERRKETVKIVHKIAEEAKITIRTARHEALDKIKKDETLSEDQQKQSEKELQNKVDEYNKKVEEMAKKKEQEVLTV